MQTLGLIPARYASTRFPGKPLAMIEGKPMVQWVYERAASVFPYCYVATDDERIARAVEQFGGRVVLTSDKHRSGTDRCAEALQLVCSELNIAFDVVVNIQGDEPFIRPEQLKQLADVFSDDDVRIATLVKRFAPDENIFNPNTPKVVIDSNGYALYFSRSAIPYRRGDAPELWNERFPYFKHIGLYAYRAEVLRTITNLSQSSLELAESLEQLRWLENGLRIRVVETDFETLAVDTPEDLERVKRVAREYLRG